MTKWPKQSGIYFAAAGESVKIGCSTKMNIRLSGINSATPGGIEVLGIIELDLEIAELRACEAAVHRMFRLHHERGEWFRLNDEVRQAIENLCSVPVYAVGGLSADHHHDAALVLV